MLRLLRINKRQSCALCAFVQTLSKLNIYVVVSISDIKHDETSTLCALIQRNALVLDDNSFGCFLKSISDLLPTISFLKGHKMIISEIAQMFAVYRQCVVLCKTKKVDTDCVLTT